ncbi:MAG TPA: glycosyltransferase family 8 protein [Afipia sp.]
MSTRMHIVSASDDGFAPHFAAMLHSAWLYHPDAAYYLLDAGLTRENIRKLNDFARARTISLTIIPCADSLAQRLPSISSRGTFARWLAPDVIGVDRVLYIDADATVVGPLDELYAVDLEGHPIAAIEDGDAEISQQESDLHGIRFGADYFNAGVMVMDLQQWRREDIAAKSFAYAVANPEKLLVQDQSALNAVLYRRNRKIDQIWNFFRFRDLYKLANAPRVVHYVGPTKPDVWRASPYKQLYKFHRDQTPWPLAKLPRGTRWSRKVTIRIGALLGSAGYRRRIDEMKHVDIVRTEVSDPALLRAQRIYQSR